MFASKSLSIDGAVRVLSAKEAWQLARLRHPIDDASRARDLSIRPAALTIREREWRLEHLEAQIAAGRQAERELVALEDVMIEEFTQA